jgi:acyltransferase
VDDAAAAVARRTVKAATARATPAVEAAAAGVHARRVIFIDLARALAVVMMVYGHTSSALLAPAYRAGPIYDVWLFQRGLTSSLFLLLSGFAFSIATTRHWASHMHLSPALVKRLRRFGLFIVLGYALHFPVGYIWSIADLSEAGWRAFLAVDVLQLIGVTFILVQLLAMASRSRRVFTIVSFVLAVLMVAFTPAVWRYPWTTVLPVGLAAYLSPATGSQFPIFPFAASVLLGAAAGQLYARWGASHLTAFANSVLLGAGIALTVAGFVWNAAGFDPFGSGPGQYVPRDFVMRTGVSLIILGVVAHASRRITRLPHVFGAVAQESLVVYFVHLCIVYGSVWNKGLVQLVGETLAPIQTVPIVIVLVTSMVLLAWYWNWYKHHRPRIARYAMIAVTVLLIVKLF